MGHVAFRPVICANDPLPVEVLQAGHGLSHAAGDLLMRTTTLSAALTRSTPLTPAVAACRLIAQEARAMAAVADRIEQTIAALQARAGR